MTILVPDPRRLRGMVRIRVQPPGAPAQPGARRVGDIDVQLTRRHDLVPQLVAAVRGYAGHERAVLEAVTRLRSQALHCTSPARARRVETALGDRRSLGVLALEEAYPELKASENFAAAVARPGRGRGPPAVRAALLQRRRARLQRPRSSASRTCWSHAALGFVDAEFYRPREDERQAVGQGDAADARAS